MFKKIAMGIAVVIAAVLIYAAFQPATFRIERSTRIKAAPETIFPYLNDFRKAAAWSPYEKKDPAMKRTFSGAASGTGSVYDFAGNGDVGAGRIEIVESVPARKVMLTLSMHEPFEGRNSIEYTLAPNGDATDVTWAMHGESPYLSRLVCLFFNMDQMVGKDFETGLANLKTLIEK